MKWGLWFEALMRTKLLYPVRRLGPDTVLEDCKAVHWSNDMEEYTISCHESSLETAIFCKTKHITL